MAYDKLKWLGRSVQYPNRYKETDAGDGYVMHERAPGEIYEEGTNVSPENMNNMETGVDASVMAAQMLYATMGILEQLVRRWIANVVEIFNAANAALDASKAATASAAAAQNTANTAAGSANTALSNAAAAAQSAAAAQNTANQGVSDAAAAQKSAGDAATAAAQALNAANAAQSTANKGVSDAASALSTANGKMAKVTATSGNIVVFDGSGGVKNSGIALDGFHRCKFTLSGTTLTITTVD